MSEIVTLRKDHQDSSEDDLEMFVRQWEKEFLRANPAPEDNSDFDSDNEVNPLDTIDNGVYKSSRISA